MLVLLIWTFVFQSDLVAHHHPVELWAPGRSWAEVVALLGEGVLVVEVIGHAIWTFVSKDHGHGTIHLGLVVPCLVVADHHCHHLLEWGQSEVPVRDIDCVMAHAV